jgi:hypothetical protein
MKRAAHLIAIVTVFGALLVPRPASATEVSLTPNVYDGPRWTTGNDAPDIEVYFGDVDHAETYRLFVKKVGNGKYVRRIHVDPLDGRTQRFSYDVGFGLTFFWVKDSSGKIVADYGRLDAYHVDLSVKATPNPFVPPEDDEARLKVCYDVTPDAPSGYTGGESRANWAKIRIMGFVGDPGGGGVYRSLPSALLKEGECRVEARFDGRNDFHAYGDSFYGLPDSFLARIDLRFGPTRQGNFTYITAKTHIGTYRPSSDGAAPDAAHVSV